MEYPIILDSLGSLRIARAKVSDNDISQILGLVEDRYSEVLEHCRTLFSVETDYFSGMCLEASRYFNEILKNAGFSPKVLAGEIPLQLDDWLEHHVSIIRLPATWLTVDFTAAQIDRFKGSPFLVLIFDPNQQALIDVLKKVYNWWTP